MDEKLNNTITKKVYRPDPENIPELKVHIYREGQKIKPSMWLRLVVPEDRLKALRDEDGKMWLGINARKHGDITGGLRQEGIEIHDKPTTRLQIEIDDSGRVCDFNVPVGYTYTQEQAAQTLLKMIPPQFVAETVTVSGSGFYKTLGSDIITYWGFFIPETYESDERLIEKGIDSNGHDFVSVRLNSFPEDLKM
ncbi:hypothetical protein KA017_02230 [Candidatus Woesebacteria bacterium]|nr:hypothetical protein [Candidatus Woesebacteria bacterium]